AFTKQAEIFDQLYADDKVVRYKRKRVRHHILKYAQEGGHMLELNCGTGEDAIYFAQKGFRVHATDISSGMLEVLRKKIKGSVYEGRVTTEQCSFTELEMLSDKQAYDYIYSNLGGLNCTADLERVLKSLGGLVKQGGVVTLVIISKFCLWESLLLFKGKFRTAFRRLLSNKGSRAQVEGKTFKCWYYNPSFVKKGLSDMFNYIDLEGLCTIVPPSYIYHFAEKYPKAFQFMISTEERLKQRWPWNRVGDYFIISFRKR
ncbi:MAG: class I SAM-dependent methyltransferase, partial [Flavisolibacter sp.]